MGISAGLYDQLEHINDELLDLSSSLIIIDWFLDYAEKCCIEKEQYDNGWKPDYNNVPFPVTKAAMHILIANCWTVLKGGLVVLQGAFPVRDLSATDEKVFTGSAYNLVEKENLKVVIDSIEPLQRVVDTFDWENDTLYFWAGW